VFAALTLYLTGNFSEWGLWYSLEPSFRAQSAQVAAGHFSLTQNPFLVIHDWAWTRGSAQQIWGLGVPLLRLPFDLLWQQLFSQPFPDRIALLLLALISGAAATKGAAVFCKNAPRAQQLALHLSLLILIFCAPPLIGLLGGRFFVYEEAITWGYFWVWLALGLSWLSTNQKKPALFFFASLCSGFSIFLRPTLLLYGAVFFAFAALSRQRPFWVRGMGFFVFCCPLAAWLATNMLRFGHPLEFGHALSLSDQPLLNLALKFGSPFERETTLSAGRELIAALFFSRDASNGFDFFRSLFFPGQSAAPRFREFYFFSYDCLMLSLLALAWIETTGAFAKALRAKTHPGFAANCGLASFAISLALFLFYLRSPSLASRFSADFAPAFSLAVYSLVYSVITASGVPYSRCKSIAAITLLGGLHVWWLTQSFQGPEHQWQSATQVPSEALLQTGAELPLISKEYICPLAGRPFGMIHGASGWDLGASCSVRGATPLLMPWSECLVIDLSTTQPSAPTLLVKRELTSLSLVRFRTIEEGLELTFCTPPSERPSSKTPPALFWIAWTDPWAPSPEPLPFRVARIATGERG